MMALLSCAASAKKFAREIVGGRIVAGELEDGFRGAIRPRARIERDSFQRARKAPSECERFRHAPRTPGARARSASIGVALTGKSACHWWYRW